MAVSRVCPRTLDQIGEQDSEPDQLGTIPQDLAPILERLQIGGEAGWLQLMGQLSRLVRRAAGRPQSLLQEREQRGWRLMQGIRHTNIKISGSWRKLCIRICRGER